MLADSQGTGQLLMRIGAQYIYTIDKLQGVPTPASLTSTSNLALRDARHGLSIHKRVRPSVAL